VGDPVLRRSITQEAIMAKLNTKQTQDALLALYKEVNRKIYPIILEKIQGLDSLLEWPLCPLYLVVDEDYTDADIRIMIFHQDIGNEGLCMWSDYKNNSDTLIEKSGAGQYIYTEVVDMEKQFISLLEQRCPGKKVEFIDTNLIKMGVEAYEGQYTTPFWYKTITKPYLNGLILQEIEVLKPDYLLFFTGPKYDKYINDIFGNPPKCTVQGFAEKDLCRLGIPNVKKALRTHRVSYLSYRYKHSYTDFLNVFVEEFLMVSGI
jgi:hypothetical protein